MCSAGRITQRLRNSTFRQTWDFSLGDCQGQEPAGENEVVNLLVFYEDVCMAIAVIGLKPD